MNNSNENNEKEITVNKNQSIIMTVIGVVFFLISIYKLYLETEYYSIFIIIGTIALIIFILGSISLSVINKN